MKHAPINSVTAALALIFFFATVSVAAAPRHPANAAREANVSLFATLRQIDSDLTAIDRNMQQIDEQIKQSQNGTSRRSQARELRQLRRSRQLRSLRRSSRSLLALSARAEARYRKSKQRYGALLFASLHRRALAMRRSERRLGIAANWNTVQQANKAFSKDLLSYILQFQAISGGYAALECGAGEWSCCQPKTVAQTGMSSIRGCTWLCVQHRAQCRNGCLGPRTPPPPRASSSATTATK